MIIHPPAVEPVSQLQLRVCRRRVRASLVREVQLDRYFPLGPKLQSLGVSATGGQFRFGHAECSGSPRKPVRGAENTPQRRALHKKRRLSLVVESRRWPPVYGILSGPCMI